MNTNLKPNLQAAQAFLTMLDRTGIFTFQTIHDNKDRKNSSLNRVFHGKLDQHAETLVRLQQKGAGIFVMVNKGDGIAHEGKSTCRTASSVIAIRALFADLDGAPLQPVLDALQPDIVVETSPGRWHCYWLVDDCPLEEFTPRQKQLAAKFNGDPVVIDLPRVMRLPGFFHLKAKPFMTRVIYPKGCK